MIFFQPEPTTPAKPSGPTNDCEIVCVSRQQRHFAERIEARLKVIGLKIDVLFPNPGVDLQNIIADISSRGVRFAILVTPLNDLFSVTLNILQGNLQEHKNIPLEDAISMIQNMPLEDAISMIAEPTTPAKPPGKSNDCEIICVSRQQRQFTERIEARLKVIGLKVDVLFPNPKVDLQKIIANISSRGVMFAILVTPLNEDHNSVTLNILQGDLQEHRNMPLEDAISMIAHIFEKGLNNTDQSQGNVAK